MTPDEEYVSEQRRLHAAIPAELQDLYRDASRVDDRMKQVAWLAKSIRAQALYHAVICAFDGPFPDTDVVELAVTISARLAWPDHVTDSAVRLERKAAKQRALDVLSRMEKRVRTLAYERAQGSRILGEATAIADQAGLFVPSDLILALVKRVVQSTVRIGHARRAG